MGYVSVVTARRCIFAGVKNVSMLYFLIMEQRWTDIPTMPGIASSSSTLTSKVLSLPEAKEFYLVVFFKADTLFWVILLRRPICDFLAFAYKRLEARKSIEGLCYGYRGGTANESL